MIAIKRTFWARVETYEPFRMGGELRQSHRYKLKGVARVAAGHDVFVTKRRKKKKHLVYHIETGGFICVGTSEVMALQKARRLIKSTPDFKKQLKEAGPVMRLTIRDADETIRKLERAGK